MNLSPLSKSTYQRYLVCPWKAHAIKNLGLKDISGPAAEEGIEAHLLTAQVLTGEMTLDEALRHASSETIQTLVTMAVSQAPFDSRNELCVESHLIVDKKGELVEDENKGIAHGYLDVIEPRDDELFVVDWKFGKWVKDDEFERHMYAGLLAPARFPVYRVIRFQLRYVKVGAVLESTYEFNEKRTTCQVTDPEGKRYRLQDAKGALVGWITAIIRRITHTNAVPNPGRHCESWYGRPCVFHGYECPLSSKLPAITSEVLPPYENFKRAFLLMKDHPDTVLDPAVVGDAYFALSQIEQALTGVRNNIKEWAKRNGPFKVGDSRYGWKKRRSYTVDEEYCLRMLFESGMEFDEMVQYLNLSKTSLSKLSKQDWPELREAILKLGISQETVPTFGHMTKEGEDE